MNTQQLKDQLATLGELYDPNSKVVLHTTVAYHLSRCGDALERIANHLENGQLSLLREEDLIQALRNMSASRY